MPAVLIAAGKRLPLRFRAIVEILPKMSRFFVDKDLHKCYNKLSNATFFTYNIANYLFLAHFMRCILVSADR